MSWIKTNNRSIETAIQDVSFWAMNPRTWLTQIQIDEFKGITIYTHTCHDGDKLLLYIRRGFFV